MLRDLGQPIMSHYETEVKSIDEILDGRDRPARPGEIVIDLTSVAETLVSAAHSVDRGRVRIVNQARSVLSRVKTLGADAGYVKRYSARGVWHPQHA
jgi:hypothetical protein